MTTPAVAQPEPGGELSPASRVVKIFVSPATAFAGLDRRPTWWLPYIILAIVSLCFVFVIDSRITFDKVSENQIKLNHRAVERLEKLPPDQRQRQYEISAKITKYMSYASPAIMLLIFVVIAAVLLATFNFGFGATLQFGTVFAVVVHSFLPSVLRTLLSIITILAGVDPDGFNIRNPIASNPGAFIDAGASPALYTFASSFDLFTFWTLILAGIGVSCVSRIKRGTAIAAVFGWWAFITLISVAIAAL